MRLDEAYVLDMLNASRRALSYVSGVDLERFRMDDMMRDAVLRRLEIVGEAARRVSPRYTSRHPEVPWRETIDMRNLLVHQYGDVDIDIVWETLHTDIAELVQQLTLLVDA